MMNRRLFLGTGALALLASGCRSFCTSAAPTPGASTKVPFTFGVAGYTFHQKCADHGVTGYGVGPIYFKKDEARRYFDYAKAVGVKVLVAVPYEDGVVNGKKQRCASRACCEALDALCREYDIRVAIHNHGPNSPEMFPDVEYGYNLIKDLDKRIGFCMDVGWEFGCDRDPAETIRKYGDRLYDIHLKNFAVNVKGAHKIGKNSFTTVPMPRGKLDYASIFKALSDVGYTGVCSFEYERDFTDNFAGMSENIGYFRGVMDSLR